MTFETTPSDPLEDQAERPLLAAMLKGVRGRCPSCGETKLFAGGLKIQDSCQTCSEALHHHRADDLPAYLNIFIVGHIVVAMAMILMDAKIFGVWPLVTLSASLAVLLSICLMRPLKGMVVALQWALRMHGFGGHDD
ncbi:MAG: DUF983 domain-containing protein [Rhizobiaceae bacterium]